jgi:DNA-binding GntR family transcriptional regulator
MMQVVDLRSAKNTLGDLAYGYLLRAILSHELRPGMRLRPEDLAAQMGLSPTPVKHALARLAGEGLVEHRTGLGPFVAEPTVDEILDLYGCRLMCELHVVREGFNRVDDRFLEELHRRLDEHAAACAVRDDTFESQRRVLEADRDFHQCYMELWPNAKATAWYSQLNTHIRSFQISNRMIARPGMLVEHQDIYTAFAARDLDRTLDAVRTHLELAKQSFLVRATSAAVASETEEPDQTRQRRHGA